MVVELVFLALNVLYDFWLFADVTTIHYEVRVIERFGVEQVDKRSPW